ncbi:hypothetical protein BJ138DRAFT_1191204 [Hygrophoropsis aurantiaca]|uniref:Uncharacterized protein n=1 Tax=Hygrophoropsis aurantiaca TaxID=72124 RepID=A0ACB7ZTG3_9AGAM|nr:hypothetical protein BJ138DRAFT_1191204 [Hygrophoropsis aurantiaca]
MQALNIFQNKLTHAMDKAYCSIWNERNIEHNWYEAWNTALMAIFFDIPQAGVAPQKSLDVSRRLLDERVAELDNNNNNDDAGNLSDTPSHATIPAPDRVERFPDFAVTLTLEPEGENECRVSHAVGDSAAVLVEVKKYVSRHLDVGGARFMNSMANLLREAETDVYAQALHAFVRHPHLTSIWAIGTCGPWWSGALIERQNIAVELNDFIRDTNTQGLMPRIAFSGAVMLNIQDESWEEIRQWLVDLVGALAG